MGDNLDMCQNQVRQGVARIDGVTVAEIELRQQWIEDRVSFPMPGATQLGVKDLSHWGQAYLRFLSVRDEGFQARLDGLVDFVFADRDRQRQLRDAGRRSLAVDLVLDDGQAFRTARVEPPTRATRSARVTEFPVFLPI